MNKRKIKKRSSIRRKRVEEIISLALQVNGLGRRKKEVTGKLPTVFFRFFGHVAGLEVEICTEGYEIEQEEAEQRRRHRMLKRLNALKEAAEREDEEDG